MSDIVERILERKTKVDSWIANCDRIAELMAPEMERFEKREGHNIYATRLAVDHESEKRGHVKHVEELTDAADTITALRAEVERMREALAFIGHLATCDHGHAHYCPNCDRSLSEIGDTVQTALTQTKDTTDG